MPSSVTPTPLPPARPQPLTPFLLAALCRSLHCRLPRWKQIFSTYGYVQKIHIFERDGRTTALVQYPDVRTADVARAALQGHAMYDGGHNKVSEQCTASAAP